ncbi:glycosyltransferase [Salinispira pacifica]
MSDSNGKQPKERILFLYLSTGGGHISAARALADTIREHYGPNEVEVYLLDGIPQGDKFQRSVVEKGYMYMSSRYPLLWTGLYELTRIPLVMHLQTAPMTNHSWKHIERFIEEKQITRIVVLHFLLIRSVARLIKRRKKPIPALTVVTDPFTVHPIWFFRQFMPVVVFSSMAKQTACLRYGYPSGLVRILPPVLNRKYNKPLPADKVRELKQQYGFDPDKRMVLMVGGGEGLPQGATFLRKIRKRGTDVEIAFVCGKNAELRKSAERIAKRYPNHTTMVYGFVDFMYELMNMADLVITKAGPATVLETLILGKPLIVTKYIYGQERGNMEFVVRNRLGYYITDADHLADRVDSLIDDPEALERLDRSIQETPIRNGTEAIADYIMKFDAQYEYPKLIPIR